MANAVFPVLKMRKLRTSKFPKRGSTGQILPWGQVAEAGLDSRPLHPKHATSAALSELPKDVAMMMRAGTVWGSIDISSVVAIWGPKTCRGANSCSQKLH